MQKKTFKLTTRVFPGHPCPKNSFAGSVPVFLSRYATFSLTGRLLADAPFLMVNKRIETFPISRGAAKEICVSKKRGKVA
jgi:hypothetical protein